MSFDRDQRSMTRAEAELADIDVGLRQHMLQVYNYMASGVALTGIVAWFTANSPAMMSALFGSPVVWLVMLAPLAFVLVLSFGIHRLSLFAAQAIFWVFAGVMGLSLATIFVVYTGESIARVFFITAASFGALSLYGYTTKRDLAPIGAFLFMGLIGIVIAGLVNMFLQSSGLQFAISVIGVLVFAGLTAYDTQRIKSDYYEGDASETRGKKAVMGALMLYLDFINLMIMLLHLLGNRR
jgi:FtsH-binding integral membrane protein